MRTVFADRTTDGNSGPVHLGVFREGTLLAFGDWDGASVALEASLDGTNWVQIDDALTDDGGLNFVLNSRSAQVRAVISSAGSGTSLTVQLDVTKPR